MPFKTKAILIKTSNEYCKMFKTLLKQLFFYGLFWYSKARQFTKNAAKAIFPTRFIFIEIIRTLLAMKRCTLLNNQILNEYYTEDEDVEVKNDFSQNASKKAFNVRITKIDFHPKNYLESFEWNFLNNLQQYRNYHLAELISEICSRKFD